MRCSNTVYYVYLRKLSLNKKKNSSTIQVLSNILHVVSICAVLKKLRTIFLSKHKKNVILHINVMPFHANKNMCLAICQNRPCLVISN